MDEDGDYVVVVNKEEGLDPTDPNAIYLIDHAWTYTPDQGMRVCTSSSVVIKCDVI